MNQERLQLKGQIADVEHEIRGLDIQISGSIVLIRNYLNPYEEDVTRLKVQEALVEMSRLAEMHTKMVSLKSRLGLLKDMLNG